MATDDRCDRHANRASIECCSRALCSRARSLSAAMLCVRRSWPPGSDTTPWGGGSDAATVVVDAGGVGGGGGGGSAAGGVARGDEGGPEGDGEVAEGVEPPPDAVVVAVWSRAQQSCPLSFSAASMDLRCMPARGGGARQAWTW